MTDGAGIEVMQELHRRVLMGTLVERFAALEFTVGQLAKGLIRDEIAGPIVTSRAGVGQLTDIARLILEKSTETGEPRQPASVLAALKEVPALMAERNLLIHGVQMHTADEGPIVFRSVKNSAQFGHSTASAEHLQNLINRANELISTIAFPANPPAS